MGKLIRCVEINPAVSKVFSDFASDPSLFALPLAIQGTTLQDLPPVAFPKDSRSTFQQALNQLDPIFSHKTALYLVLRHGEALVAITYIPYRANAELKALLLDNREHLVNRLGSKRFDSSIICKEVNEIIDARSWDERSDKGRSWGQTNDEDEAACDDCGPSADTIRDLGHKKNRCRLCDRRMKNKIDDAALDALKSLDEGGDCVQLVSKPESTRLTSANLLESVNVSTEVLQLNFYTKNLAVVEVSARLPTDKPSFTFYRHASNNRLYFIFCSPDSANVKERMKHTMAIPGLVNVIAQDNCVNVDQKLEIHDPKELYFDKEDKRIGKFRSMYLRNEFAGTESQWDGKEEQQKILDAVR